MYLSVQVNRLVSISLLLTVFPHIRPAGIIILHSLQMRVLLENTTFPLHKIVRIAGIIRGRELYEEIRYVKVNNFTFNHFGR